MCRHRSSLVTLLLLSLGSSAFAQSEKKPNILVIFGDDIGVTNLSCYSDGLMGYHTPNIDRIANEGMRFTDSYGEQSCTAGRSAFITGQSVYRTGLSKVGIPGSPIGLSAEDPTIAELLKPLGVDARQELLHELLEPLEDVGPGGGHRKMLTHTQPLRRRDGCDLHPISVHGRSVAGARGPGD